MTEKKRENGAPGASEPDEVTGVTQVTPADEAAATKAGAGEEVTAAAAPAAPGEAGEEAAAAVAAHRPSRLRRVLIGLLVVLCSLAVVVTGVAWWAHYTVMNTDGYMKIVGPIGKDPQAIQNLSQYIGNEIVSTTDLQQRVQNALPSQVQMLSGPITAYVEGFITRSADKILSTPKAYQLWLQINRVGHEKVVAMLRGQTNGVYIKGDNVTLNTLPLISQVLVWVDQRLPGGLSSRFNPPVIPATMSPEQGIQQVANWSGKPLPSDFGQITLLQSNALGPAQTAVKWFDRLVWILPLVTAALMALTIWLSRRRARTAIAIGVGAAIAIFVARVIIVRGSEYLTNQVAAGSTQHIVKQIVDGSLGPLTTLTVWVCVVGVVAAVLVWLLGRRDVRAGVVAAGRRVAGQTAEIHIPDSPVTSWVVNHAVGVRWAVLVAGLIVLALTTSSWLGIVLTIVIEVLLQGVLSLITGQWPFEERESDGAARA